MALSRLRAHALLLAVALGGALLVAGWPQRPDRLILTRQRGGFDPLQTAVLLRFGVDSLLHHPSRYFSPPILYPDPNPLRGTEPLVAEALLAAPVRLAVGDRPALVYTLVRILSLALLSGFTTLLLRELGVRLSLALLGGGLSVLIGTTTIFFDRLQALSLQWLPLALLLAVRALRQGRAWCVAAFALAAFLTVQASLYTAVMLLALAPFLAPALLALRGEPAVGRRLAALGLAGLLAAGASMLVLWPWLADRWDLAPYSSPAALQDKDWWNASLGELAARPPEYGGRGQGPELPVRSDGSYPGTVFLVTVVAAAVLAVRARGSGLGLAAGLLWLGASLYAACVAESALARSLGTAGLWVLLVAWSLRLGFRPGPKDEDSPLALTAGVFGLAAFVLLLLALKSPVFSALAHALPPLRELRELRRCLLPAGWAAVMATLASMERSLRARPLRGSGALLCALLLLAAGERFGPDLGTVRVPPVPAAYEQLRASGARGGLLELPFKHWNSLGSVYRMLWQPSHARPIVAGYTGLAPAWYGLAEEVLGEYPSQESLLLLREWGIDTVLESRNEGAPVMHDLPSDGPSGPLHAAAPRGSGDWEIPVAAPAPATDADADTVAEIEGEESLAFQLPSGRRLVAVQLDYALAQSASVPGQVRILALARDGWRDVTVAPTGDFLRARAADLLMKRRPARLVVNVQASAATEFRLASTVPRWELPELRVWLAQGPHRLPREPPGEQAGGGLQRPPLLAR